MAMKPIPEDRILAGQAAILAKLRDKAAESVINLDAAIDLDTAPALAWDGTVYATRPLSHRDGLILMRFQLRMQKAAANPPTTEEGLEENARTITEAVDVCWRQLVPQPEENPFADASFEEVAHLVSFFLTAPTRQTGTRLRFPAAPPSPTTH